MQPLAWAWRQRDAHERALPGKRAVNGGAAVRIK
jgi:hypothetical protein